jgi:aminopeptidase N
MKDAAARSIRLADYRPPEFLVDRVDLHFRLTPQRTRVRARLAMRRNPAAAHPQAALRLDGEGLELIAVRLDERVLAPADYRLEPGALVIPQVPDAFALETEVCIDPQGNTALEGLYRSSGNYCTQCEAEGFRKITYFPDRPDVLAVYTTTVEAERALCPVLLANGNCIETGEGEEGWHYAVWRDPHPKPSYLFALVAGDLGCVEDTFVTCSGRAVALRIYVQQHNLDQCDHAMRSLKRAMRWDEERFGREYDLDVYMIVAVDDFNMGAMENKGLNVFNSKYVLARPDTATDADFLAIEGVIAHEYFHNWTGNRVTCRDWFQLSLKEGLTVFRDQAFSAEMSSPAVKRIEDVRLLRSHQFPEDAGPMAHPVRPQAYQEINNFYTATVYEKGAEVVRMYQTLLGPEGFRRGMDLYFQRHDGQAVTTDDFRAAMADANDTDLDQFQLWYEQAGTPRLELTADWDATAGRYTLHVAQRLPATPGQGAKAAQLIPLRIALFDAQGDRLALHLPRLDGEAPYERVLRIEADEQSFAFEGLSAAPVPSLLRGFSAPVIVDYPYSAEELRFLMAQDDDPYARWEAAQRLLLASMKGMVEALRAGADPVIEPALIEAVRLTLEDDTADPALIAEALTPPDEAYLAEQCPPIDPGLASAAHRQLRRGLARALRDALLRRHAALRSAEPYGLEPRAIGARRLRNLCLAYLGALDEPEAAELCRRQFEEADNMTEQLGALRALADAQSSIRDALMDDFEARWRDEPLVLDKWFALQAGARRDDALARVRALEAHPCFSMANPNRVRALLGAFAANPLGLHAADGEGYRYLAERVVALDARNPQVAARLLRALLRWRDYEPRRQAAMHAALESISNSGERSRDVSELVQSALRKAD